VGTAPASAKARQRKDLYLPRAMPDTGVAVFVG
jgi:hypothetical protein